ncbi:hypothetical protein BpHYR1_024203 [Brachionus plicatilis]|uniref:Uncharacterized protein n=1 Tax=Brachionus plicatilis TaxID=10195 RepID=A0A3M7SH93_BRAPC|nr:hypothetical protein BpHYR1_024203 [Brachionus plicatilis]
MRKKLNSIKNNLILNYKIKSKKLNSYSLTDPLPVPYIDGIVFFKNSILFEPSCLKNIQKKFDKINLNLREKFYLSLTESLAKHLIRRTIPDLH